MWVFNPMNQNLLFAIVAPKPLNCLERLIPAAHPIILLLTSSASCSWCFRLTHPCLLPHCIWLAVKSLHSFFGSGTHLLVLLGVTVFIESLRLHRFKSYQDEILWYCSLSKCTSNDTVWFLFLVWRHNLKIAAMTSFHTEKCCHVANAHSVFAWCICCSICQFLIHSIFIPYLLTILYIYFTQPFISGRSRF